MHVTPMAGLLSQLNDLQGTQSSRAQRLAGKKAKDATNHGGSAERIKLAGPGPGV